MELRFQGSPDFHYTLFRTLDLGHPGDPIAMVLGGEGKLTLKDRFNPAPAQVFYRVRATPNAESLDTDGDGKTDYKELRPTLFVPDRPNDNPFNPIKKLDTRHGSHVLTEPLWDRFSVAPGSQGITRSLTGKRFMKFLVLPLHEPGPAMFFMNTTRYHLHLNFIRELENAYGVPNTGELRGEIALITDEAGKDWYVFQSPAWERAKFRAHAPDLSFADGQHAVH